MTVTNFSSISNSGRFDLKVDKLLNPTEGNLVKQDSEGNLVDTGISINAVSKSRVFWGYQDFSAGTIATQNVTLTELSGYPDIPFDSSNIINAAFISRSDDLEEYAYTGVFKLLSSIVKVNSISGTAVTLSGVPDSSYAIRIYFQYTHAFYPINYTAPTAILSASAVYQLDNIIATQEELATKLAVDLTDNYDAIVTNNPYLTAGVPNTAALSITTSSTDTVQKLLQILYMIYQSGIWKYHTSSTSINSLDNVTLQGNTFNGNSQLVKTDSSGKLPAIDGSLLTNISPTSDFIYSDTFSGASDTTVVNDSYIQIRFQSSTRQFQYFPKTSASWGWVDGGLIYSRGPDHTVKGDSGNIKNSTNQSWTYIGFSGVYDAQYSLNNYGTQIIAFLVKDTYSSSNPAYIIHAGCGSNTSIFCTVQRVGP